MTSDNRELFKKALVEALYSKYEEEIKESESESTVCTPAHYNNLRKLGIKVKEQRIGRISKKSFVAILVAATLLLVGCTAYVYRDKVRNFIETIYEKYIHITYNDDENLLGSELSEAYVLTYIPDGYELIEESKTPIRTYYKWENGDNNRIIFRQVTLDGATFLLDVEQGYTELLNYDNYVIYFRKLEASYHYIWNDGKYFVSIDSSVDLGTNELFAIIDGIRGTGL